MATLSHEQVMEIIQQKENFHRFREEQQRRIWSDVEFDPTDYLDTIAEKITNAIITEGTDSLKRACDKFVDSLVYAEFFPEDLH